MDDYARVQHALDLLQQAQRLIENAGQYLSPVPTSADVWSSTGDLYFEVKRHWHRVHMWSQDMRCQTDRS